MDLGCRLATFRLERLLFSFRGKFLGNCFLEHLRIQSIAFGGVPKKVTAACGGSPISRIKKSDFQKQLATFGLVVDAHLLGQKLLCGS